MNTERYRKKENTVYGFTPETRVNDPVGGQDFDYRCCKRYGLLKKWRGKRLLHIGCNSGGNSIALSWMGTRVVGVDINERAIGAARRLAKEYKQRIKFYVGNIVSMRLPERKFDAMFCSNFLEHLFPEDLEPCLLNLKRHLKKGASFYISVPKKDEIPDETHMIIFHDTSAITDHFNGKVVEEIRHFNIYR